MILLIAVFVLLVIAVALTPVLGLFAVSIDPAAVPDDDAGLTGAISFGILLSLSVALLLAARRGSMPRWVIGLALLSWLFYLYASITVPNVIKDGEPVRWMTVILFLNPALLIFYILWLIWPRVHDAVPSTAAGWIAFGGIMVLSALPAHWDTDGPGRAARRAIARAAPGKATLARFAALPPDAPVKDLIEFASYPETHADAMARIRQSPGRAAELPRLIAQGNYSAFTGLPEFDVPASPPVCDAVRQFLGGLAADANRTQGKSIGGTESYLPTLAVGGGESLLASPRT